MLNKKIAWSETKNKVIKNKISETIMEKVNPKLNLDDRATNNLIV